ncbi:MAG: Tex-like N-terminal domain-containing protein, partial [Alkalispirochaeta sp.]
MTGIDLTISRELSIPADRVAAVRSLFSEGATVPFVARYRKERTGGLDEVQLRQIIERDTELTDLEKRRGSILEMLKDQKLLTPELEQKIRSARDRNVLEDIYAPFRKRKETRADKARAAGLGPLADALFKGTDTSVVELVNTLKPASLSHEDARKGAMDILAEQAAHDVDLRQKLRRLFERQGALESKRKNRTADETYRQYFEWREPAGRTPSHRVLAMLRGAAEGALTVTLRPPEVAAIRLVLDYFVGDADSRRPVQEREGTQRQELFSEVATDSWKRLLLPSLEREALTAVRDRAVQEAVKVFQRNLEALLLAPPLGSLRVMALDPGVRTGCKVACIGPAGEFLESAQVYPLPPRSDEEGAARVLKGLCETHEIEAVAVGNGTGGRETEAFVRDRVLQPGMLLVSVDEAGASVYSASDIAREEFPDMDIHFRGAVSIGRRLQDPLAELVKIDPASIGVGQYQHDIPSGRLRDALGATVESCVNRVGVDINTAGVPLLSRVAGLSPRQAREIVL